MDLTKTFAPPRLPAAACLKAVCHLLTVAAFCFALASAQQPPAPSGTASDPGIASLPATSSACGPNLPAPLPGLTSIEITFFCSALQRFQEVDSVSGVNAPTANGTCTPVDLGHNGTGSTIPCTETGSGLGPRFNGNSCTMCHVQPLILGASPLVNPQVKLATLDGATNTLPPGINATYEPGGVGPIREIRFIDVPGTTTSDGNVHAIFTISGRVDASSAININGTRTTCTLTQPNFSNVSNLIFRIPISIQGDGLVELIDDENLENNNKKLTPAMGVTGSFNRSGNDGTITRFGWKAQNKSLMIFAGEAYNVEQGVTNEMFPNEREIDNDLLGESILPCLFNPQPDDTTNLTNTFNSGSPASDFASDVVNFAQAGRLSAPPARNFTVFTQASVEGSGGPTDGGPITADAVTVVTPVLTGQQVFEQIGCNLCHADNSTGLMVTIDGTTSLPSHQGNKIVPVFSDLAIHNMGTGLADSVSQGLADGSHFRSAPLWGLGERIYLLHDGRTSSLITAITDHQSTGSEANTVINNFLQLSPANLQSLLNYLRTL